MHITLLYEPPTGRAATPSTVGVQRYAPLIDELRCLTGGPVAVMPGTLQDAPPEGYILFAGWNWSAAVANLERCGAGQVAPRTVLLDVSGLSALPLLERYHFAGAVDSLRLSEWLAQVGEGDRLTRGSSCVGPFGHQALADAVGASCVPLPGYRSEHYCLLQSDRHEGLPHLLVDYLRVYDAALHRRKQEMGGGWAVTA